MLAIWWLDLWNNFRCAEGGLHTLDPSLDPPSTPAGNFKAHMSGWGANKIEALIVFRHCAASILESVNLAVSGGKHTFTCDCVVIFWKALKITTWRGWVPKFVFGRKKEREKGKNPMLTGLELRLAFSKLSQPWERRVFIHLFAFNANTLMLAIWWLDFWYNPPPWIIQPYVLLRQTAC